MFKNLMKLMCVLICLVIAFSGCGNVTSGNQSEGQQNAKATGEAQPAEESNLTEPGTFPIVKGKVDLTILASVSSDPNFTIEENAFTKELEEKTNIHIIWQKVTGDTVREKINLTFASGDYIDMFCTGVGVANRIDKSMEAQFGAQGLIVPLNDLIDKQSVWFKKVLEEQDGLEEYITTPDGHIYSLPNIADGYHNIYPQKMWFNKTWLDNLGLEMPKTTEEFYQVLKAFKENDANGNGDATDEIPLSSVIAGSNVELTGFLMNPFIYSPVTRMWIRDGEVVLSPMEPEYKEGLKYLNKLYEEELITPDAFTQDRNTQININENGDDPIIGAYPALRVGYGCNLKASDKWHQYVSLSPLEGPSGDKTAVTYPYDKFQTGMVCISTASKYPEEAFRLVDYMYSEEATLRSLIGREGKEWTAAGPDDFGLDGRPAKIKRLNVDTEDPEYKNKTWGQLFPSYRPKEFEFSQAFPQDPYDPEVDPMTGRIRLFYLATLEHEKVAPPVENVLSDMYYSEADIEELALLKTTIDDYITDFVTRAIVGSVDIDSEWDAYLNELKALGVDRYLEIVQSTYDAR